MYFDWVTWSIWLTGFFILVVWVWIPVKEIKKIVKIKRSERSVAGNQTEEHK